MKTFHEFKLGRINFNKCKECSCEMSLEGPIMDDIDLCHACYSNESLVRHGYFTAEEI
jgi:hypothetical protein